MEKPSSSRTSVRPSEKVGRDPQMAAGLQHCPLQSGQWSGWAMRLRVAAPQWLPATWSGPPAAQLLPNPHPAAGTDARTTGEFRGTTQDELQREAKPLASHQVWKQHVGERDKEGHHHLKWQSSFFLPYGPGTAIWGQPFTGTTEFTLSFPAGWRFLSYNSANNISDLYLQVNTNLQFQQHTHQGKIPTAVEVTEKPVVSDQRQDCARQRLGPFQLIQSSCCSWASPVPRLGPPTAARGELPPLPSPAPAGY